MASIITEATDQVVYRAGSTASDTAKSRIRGSLPYLEFTASGPNGTVTWGDGSAGGMFLVSGANDEVMNYIPRNQSKAITISATDGDGTIGRALTIEATFPIHPQVGFEGEIDIETKIKMAKDRTRYFREDGAEEVGWVFGFDARENDARMEIQTFWRDHRKVVPFWLIDTESDMMNRVWFISSFKWIVGGANKFNMVVGFKGVLDNLLAFENDPIDPGDPVPTGDSVLFEGVDVSFEGGAVLHIP